MTTNASGLHPLAYVVVAFSMVGMLAMGAYLSRRQTSTEDYFVAGRKMPWFMVGLSMLATLTSTISYLAVPGEMIRTGFGYFTGQIALPFVALFVIFVSIPFFMRLKLTSVYEYLEWRFGYGVRALGASIFASLLLGWNGVVVLTAARAMAQMTGMPLLLVILGVGLVATVYTTLGGIRADIWTDVVQFFIMFGGAVFTIGYIAVVTGTGPLDWWQDAARIEHTSAPLFSLDPSVRVTTFWVTLNGLFWYICTCAGSQVALQRFFTMPSVRAAQRSFILNMLADVAMMVLLAGCGVALLSFYLSQKHLLPANLDPTTPKGADSVFPYFIAHQLPPVLCGLVISALFAAAMSTLDSGVNSLSAVLTMDFYRRWRPANPNADELRLAKWLTLTLGFAITGMAVAIDRIPGEFNIVDLSQKGFNCVVGPLGAMFFAGMFLPRCTSRSVIPATLFGLAVGVVLAYWEVLFREINEELNFNFTFWVIPCSCVATFLTAALLSLIESPRHEKRFAGLTWASVVRGGADKPVAAGFTPAHER